MKTIQNFKNSVLKIKTGDPIKVQASKLSSYSDDVLSKFSYLHLSKININHHYQYIINYIIREHRKPFTNNIQNLIFYKIMSEMDVLISSGYLGQDYKNVKEIILPITLFAIMLFKNNYDLDIDNHEECIFKIEECLIDNFHPCKKFYDELQPQSDGVFSIYRFTIPLLRNVKKLSKIIYKFLFLINNGTHSNHLDIIKDLISELITVVCEISNFDVLTEIKVKINSIVDGHKTTKETKGYVVFNKKDISVSYEVEQKDIKNYKNIIKNNNSLNKQYCCRVDASFRNTKLANEQAIYYPVKIEYFCLGTGRIVLDNKILYSLKDSYDFKAVIARYSFKGVPPYKIISDETDTIESIEIDFTPIAKDILGENANTMSFDGIHSIIFENEKLKTKFFNILHNSADFEKLNLKFRHEELNNYVAKIKHILDNYNEDDKDNNDKLVLYIYKLYRIIYSKEIKNNEELIIAIDELDTLLTQLKNIKI